MASTIKISTSTAAQHPQMWHILFDYLLESFVHQTNMLPVPYTYSTVE